MAVVEKQASGDGVSDETLATLLEGAPRTKEGKAAAALVYAQHVAHCTDKDTSAVDEEEDD